MENNTTENNTTETKNETKNTSTSTSFTRKSEALIRTNIRKYGGMLTPPTDLPNDLKIHIVGLKLLDPKEIVETQLDYNIYATDPNLYQMMSQRDDDDVISPSEKSQIVIFGRTEEGYSVCARIPFTPFLYLHVPGVTWSNLVERDSIKTYFCRVLKLNEEDIVLTVESMKRLYEWIPDPKDHTKTEELKLLKIQLPNKHCIEKLTDSLDPNKACVKLLNNVLKKVKFEIEKLKSKKTKKQKDMDAMKKDVERMHQTLKSVDYRVKRIKDNINFINNRYGSLNGGKKPIHNNFIQSKPSVNLFPSLETEHKSLIELWKECQKKYDLVFDTLEWWKVTGFRVNGFSNPILPLLWETEVDYAHKFCDQTKIVPSGWVQISNYQCPGGYISHSQIECMVSISDIKPIDNHSMAPLLIASVDGEMYSSDHNKFPRPYIKEDCLINIGVVLCRTNSNEMEKFVFCLKETDPVPGATVFYFDTEKELLNAYRHFIVVHVDPDILIGYNTLGFDWKYFAMRAAEKFNTGEKKPKKEVAPVSYNFFNNPKNQQLATKTNANNNKKTEMTLEEKDELESDSESESESDSESKPDEDKVNSKVKFQSKGSKKSTADDDEEEEEVEDSKELIVNDEVFFWLGRIWAEKTPCRSRVFKSSAYGERWSYHFDMTGRADQDLLVYIRREKKLESYRLGNVSTIFLKDTKIDLEPKEIFKNFEKGPKERSITAGYCVKDCELPIRLCKHPKLMIIQNIIEMSRVTNTPLDQIISRGQQIKVFNQVVSVAHKMGCVMNDQPYNEIKDYAGATVLEPERGFHDFPVTVLDFSSLYPSIIRNKNLCFSTLVLREEYKNLPGVEYNRIKVGNRVHVFVVKSVLEGVLPNLEKFLLAARKQTKANMKGIKETNPDMYAMLDAKQLAIKVSCNSAYGFTGASTGMYPCLPIAESITSTGRVMIETTRSFILKNYPNSDVLYGDTDSVMIKFDVSADKEGLKKSFELGREVAEDASKIFGEAVSLEMEKVYFPFLLLDKKKYAGLKYEDPENISCLDIKGMEPVRRDWSLLIREIYNKCLNTVFYDRDVEKSKDLVRQYCQDMIDNKLDFKLFIMSKELRSKYSNPDSQVHMAVVKKIAKRNPGSEPQAGDRVPFVIIRNRNKKAKVSEKSEDPVYAQENKVPLDYTYYIEKQLEGPLGKFFEPFMKDPSSLFTEAKRQVYNEVNGFARSGLMAYLSKSETPSTNPSQPDYDLFEGEVKETNNSQNSDSKFTIASQSSQSSQSSITSATSQSIKKRSHDDDFLEENDPEIELIMSRRKKQVTKTTYKPNYKKPKRKL